MEIQFSSALLQDRSAVWNKPSNDSIQFLVQFNRRIKESNRYIWFWNEVSARVMRQRNSLLFLHWSNWSGYYANSGANETQSVVMFDPGMSKNHLWLCFGDVLTSTRQWLLTDCTPIQLPFWPWRNLDTAVLQSFCVNGTDWFLRNVIDQFNLQFLANVQSFCCWWALNYQSIKELLRPAGQKMQLFDCPIFNYSEVITTTQFATDSYKAIIMGWFWQSWVDILAPNLRLAPGKEFWFNSIQVWPSHLHHKQATQYFERSHCKPIQQQCHANTCPCNNIYFYKLS